MTIKDFRIVKVAARMRGVGALADRVDFERLDSEGWMALDLRPDGPDFRRKPSRLRHKAQELDERHERGAVGLNRVVDLASMRKNQDIARRQQWKRLLVVGVGPVVTEAQTMHDRSGPLQAPTQRGAECA